MKGRWLDPMDSESQLYNDNKRKSREGTEDSTAMPHDGSELHAQKVHKTGPIVSEGLNGNAVGVKEENYCLEETSCNYADTSDSDKTAQSRLSEICSTNKWKWPVYELLEEVGLTKNVMFKCKVTVLINTYSLTVLECFSSPNSQREAAQEHAAEGALWYLKHLLY